MRIQNLIMISLLLLISSLSFGQEVLGKISASRAEMLRAKLLDIDNSLSFANIARIELSSYYIIRAFGGIENSVDSSDVQLKSYFAFNKAKKNDPQYLLAKIIQARILHYRGKTDSANLNFAEAIHTAKETGSVLQEGIAWFYMGAYSQRWNDADYRLNQAIRCFVKTGDYHKAAIAERLAADMKNLYYFTPITFNWRSSDPAKVSALLIRLKTGKSSTEKLDACLNLAQIYNDKPGALKVNIDTAFQFQNIASGIIKKNRIEKRYGDLLLCRVGSYLMLDDVASAKKQISISNDTIKIFINYLIADHYKNKIGDFRSPNFQNMDSSAHYFKRGLEQAALRKNFWLIKLGSDGLLSLASTYSDRNKIATAEDIGNYLFENRLKRGYPSTIHAAYRLYVVSVKLGKLFKAMTLALAAKKALTASTVPILRSFCYYMNSDIYYFSGNPEKGNEFLLSMINDRELYKEPNFYLYENVGGYIDNLKLLRQTQKGIDLIKKLKLTRPPEKDRDLFAYYFSLGSAYQDVGQYDLAEENYSQAVTVTKRMPYDLGYTRARLASVYFLQGRYQKAKDESADELAKPNPSEYYRTALYSWTARIDSGLKNYPSALTYLNKSIRLTDSLNVLAEDKHSRALEFEDASQKNSAEILSQESKINLLAQSASSLRQKALLNRAMLRQEDLLTAKKKSEMLLKSKEIEELTQNKKIRAEDIRATRLIWQITAALIGLSLIIIIIIILQFMARQRLSNQIVRKNTLLEQHIKDKGWLIKEMHHRVKNNLQMVISLLNAQTADLEKTSMEILQHSQHKIFAISLIHQKLYQTEDLKTVDMPGFVHELVMYLKENFDKQNQNKFNLEIDLLRMDVSKAVPIGLILSEILTFFILSKSENDEKIFDIHLKDAPERQFSLEIIYLDGDIQGNVSQKPDLDLNLVSNLAEQLKADFDIDKSKLYFYLAAELLPKVIFNTGQGHQEYSREMLENQPQILNLS